MILGEKSESAGKRRILCRFFNSFFAFELGEDAPADVFADNETDALRGATATEVFAPDIEIEAVVDGELFAFFDRSIGKIPNAIVTKTGGAVGIARMINVTSDAPVFGAINIPFFVEFEHEDVGRFPFGFSFLTEEFASIRFSMRNFFAGVFDDLGSRRNRSFCVNTFAMNFRISDFQIRMVVFGQREAWHRRKGIYMDLRRREGI